MELERLSGLPHQERIPKFFDHLARRRAVGAVGPGARPGAVEVYRFAEAVEVLTDHDTFSSDMSGAIAPDQAQLARAASGHLAGIDPPRHTALRSLVSAVFTPRTVAKLEPRIAALARDLLDRAEESATDSTIDIVDGFASPLTATVIAELFGIPDTDHARFVGWADTLLGAKPPEAVVPDEEAHRRIGELLGEVTGYFTALITARRSDPGDDLTSGLVRSELGGKPLSGDEIIGVISMFLLAGYLPTSVLIGNAVMCLDEHPAAAGDLRARPELLPAVLEEVLRWRPPLARDVRVATRDVDLAGTSITAGSTVCVWLAAANRDELRWPDAGTFDIHRPTATHVAWGRGIHHCLGSTLARLEARVAMTALLERFDHLAVAEDRPVRMHPSLGILGPSHLPVVARRTRTG